MQHNKLNLQHITTPTQNQNLFNSYIKAQMIKQNLRQTNKQKIFFLLERECGDTQPKHEIK